MVINAALRLFPERTQIGLKKVKFHFQILLRKFRSIEPDYTWIRSVLGAGDNVIDIGASVGLYTYAFSKLVGKTGRVFSFEPIPESFYLLTSNIRFCRYKNVSLFNTAISDREGLVRMRIPRNSNGLRNYYRSAVIQSLGNPLGDDFFEVYSTCLDSFSFPKKIKLIKIDIEGHESQALRGMKRLIHRDKPYLIIEGETPIDNGVFFDCDYKKKRLANSPNEIFYA